jgi:hypothetical protein
VGDRRKFESGRFPAEFVLMSVRKKLKDRNKKE